MSRKAKMYSVYSAKDDKPLIIFAYSKECAKKMGVTMNTFYRYIVWMRQGKRALRKWNVYEDGFRGEENGN